MNEISAKYFSTKFIIENKLNLTDIVILEYIYSWVLSDRPPEYKEDAGVKAFYLSQSHIANDFCGLITQANVSQKMKRLVKCGLIETKILEVSKFYMVFHWDKVLESLAPIELLKEQKYKFSSNWFEKIHQYAADECKNKEKWLDEWKNKSIYERIEYYKKNENKEKNESMSYKLTDLGIKITHGYSKQADAIAKKILKNYPQIFVTRYPKNELDDPTKTYKRLCQKIDDIYSGNFINSRFYKFDENVFNNKQFETEGWKDKIKEVKGDWSKVRKLIFRALENFILMFEENKMPLSKDYLTNNLNDWFFSDNPNNKGQSQFIQSLNEPMMTKEKLGLNKAISIVKELKEKSPVTYYSGHELNELLPINANETIAWTFIKKIVSWGELLSQYDGNAGYFLECKINGEFESGAKVLPALFANFLKERNINVSLNTLDIEKAIDNNGPWCWFIQDACDTFSLNHDVVRCYDKDDFYESYSEINLNYETMIF